MNNARIVADTTIGKPPARLVRPPPSRPALARSAARLAARHAARSLPCLAVGDHAAADHGRGGKTLFPQFPGEMADVSALAAAADRGRHEGLGRARLLFARPQPEEMRRPGGGDARRPVSRHRGRPARAARHRRLYGSGHRGDRLRPAGGGRRRQCRAGDVAAVCDRDALARREARDPRHRWRDWCLPTGPAISRRR